MTTQTPRVNVDGLSLTLRSRQAKYSFWVSIVYNSNNVNIWKKGVNKGETIWPRNQKHTVVLVPFYTCMRSIRRGRRRRLWWTPRVDTCNSRKNPSYAVLTFEKLNCCLSIPSIECAMGNLHFRIRDTHSFSSWNSIIPPLRIPYENPLRDSLPCPCRIQAVAGAAIIPHWIHAIAGSFLLLESKLLLAHFSS